MVANQTTMIGPKTLPMPVVPRFWTMKRTISTRQVMGTMNGLAASVATSNPSIAESTEIEGVMMPSPYSSAAPKIPPMMTADRSRDESEVALAQDEAEQGEDPAFAAVCRP